MNGGKDIPAAPRYIHSHRTPVNGCPMPLVDRGNSGNIGALDLVRIVEHEVATKKKTAVLIDTVRLGGRRVVRYSTFCTGQCQSAQRLGGSAAAVLEASTTKAAAATLVAAAGRCSHGLGRSRGTVRRHG